MDDRHGLLSQTKEGKTAEAWERLRLADSVMAGYWLGILLGRTKGASKTWRAVGERWPNCDRLTPYRFLFDPYLREYRNTRGFPIVEAMAPAERAAYDALPETVVVYRGCYANNRLGLAWSLNRATATTFATQLARYWQPGRIPLLLTGHVRRRNIAFVKLDRNEQEIVTPSRCVHVTRQEKKRHRLG